jgi:type VI secretion system secreted protein VgrG
MCSKGGIAMQDTLRKPACTFQLSAKGIDLLKSIEQARLEPYDDQTGNPITSWVKGATIGYGHLIARDEWNKYADGINQEQADALFMQDLEPFLNAVRSKVTPDITQNQFDALVIFVFNIGISGFSTSSALKLVNDPGAATPYPNLEAAWKAWNKSQGQVMQGLVNRRNVEWDIYSKNIYQRW